MSLVLDRRSSSPMGDHWMGDPCAPGMEAPRARAKPPLEQQLLRVQTLHAPTAEPNGCHPWSHGPSYDADPRGPDQRPSLQRVSSLHKECSAQAVRPGPSPAEGPLPSALRRGPLRPLEGSNGCTATGLPPRRSRRSSSVDFSMLPPPHVEQPPPPHLETPPPPPQPPRPPASRSRLGQTGRSQRSKSDATGNLGVPHRKPPRSTSIDMSALPAASGLNNDWTALPAAKSRALPPHSTAPTGFSGSPGHARRSSLSVQDSRSARAKRRAFSGPVCVDYPAFYGDPGAADRGCGPLRPTSGMPEDFCQPGGTVGSNPGHGNDGSGSNSTSPNLDSDALPESSFDMSVNGLGSFSPMCSEGEGGLPRQNSATQDCFQQRNGPPRLNSLRADSPLLQVLQLRQAQRQHEAGPPPNCRRTVSLSRRTHSFTADIGSPSFSAYGSPASESPDWSSLRLAHREGNIPRAISHTSSLSFAQMGDFMESPASDGGSWLPGPVPAQGALPVPGARARRKMERFGIPQRAPSLDQAQSTLLTSAPPSSESSGVSRGPMKKSASSKESLTERAMSLAQRGTRGPLPSTKAPQQPLRRAHSRTLSVASLDDYRRTASLTRSEMPACGDIFEGACAGGGHVPSGLAPVCSRGNHGASDLLPLRQVAVQGAEEDLDFSANATFWTDNGSQAHSEAQQVQGRVQKVPAIVPQRVKEKKLASHQKTDSGELIPEQQQQTRTAGEEQLLQEKLQQQQDKLESKLGRQLRFERWSKGMDLHGDSSPVKEVAPEQASQNSQMSLESSRNHSPRAHQCMRTVTWAESSFTLQKLQVQEPPQQQQQGTNSWKERPAPLRSPILSVAGTPTAEGLVESKLKAAGACTEGEQSQCCDASLGSWSCIIKRQVGEKSNLVERSKSERWEGLFCPEASAVPGAKAELKSAPGTAIKTLGADEEAKGLEETPRSDSNVPQGTLTDEGSWKELSGKRGSGVGRRSSWRRGASGRTGVKARLKARVVRSRKPPWVPSSQLLSASSLEQTLQPKMSGEAFAKKLANSLSSKVKGRIAVMVVPIGKRVAIAGRKLVPIGKKALCSGQKVLLRGKEFFQKRRQALVKGRRDGKGRVSKTKNKGASSLAVRRPTLKWARPLKWSSAGNRLLPSKRGKVSASQVPRCKSEGAASAVRSPHFINAVDRALEEAKKLATGLGKRDHQHQEGEASGAIKVRGLHGKPFLSLAKRS